LRDIVAPSIPCSGTSAASTSAIFTRFMMMAGSFFDSGATARAPEITSSVVCGVMTALRRSWSTSVAAAP
jgi:hypothetical protein